MDPGEKSDAAGSIRSWVYCRSSGASPSPLASQALSGCVPAPTLVPCPPCLGQIRADVGGGAEHTGFGSRGLTA